MPQSQSSTDRVVLGGIAATGRWCACALAALVTFQVVAISSAADKPAITPDAALVQRVTFKNGKKEKRVVAGQVLVEADDGGLLVLGPDGRLWTVEKGQLESRVATEKRFAPLAADALGRQLQGELGPGFDVITTKHYVICTSAGKPYAQWCGGLFERLFSAFHNYWKQRGVKWHEPEFPLAALVFSDERQFAEFATKDAGPDVATAKGYYSIKTNRIVLFDLTAGQEVGVGDAEDISRRLAAAPYNIATVVHEATHQIAFNSGLHTRYADNPLWLMEGMAMYFETPDLTSKSGWKTVGAINDLRLRQFQDYAANRRPADALASLLRSDERFTSADQMGDAYAEAWALSYYLIKTRKESYAGYLNRIAAKPRLVWNKPEERLAEFKAAFGDDLSRLDADFLKFLKRQK